MKLLGRVVVILIAVFRNISAFFTLENTLSTKVRLCVYPSWQSVLVQTPWYHIHHTFLPAGFRKYCSHILMLEQSFYIEIDTSKIIIRHLPVKKNFLIFHYQLLSAFKLLSVP